MKKIKITLVKSLIGCKPFQKKTAETLGLRKIGDQNEHEAGPVIEGKIKQLSHLIKVENV